MELLLKLQPKQLEAFKTSNKIPVLFFGGARGGGKSYFVRARELYRRLKYPNTKGLIVRKTYPELLANHIRMYFKEYPITRDWYNKSEKIIKYPNGSTTEFSYLQNTDDVYTYQGREYEDISIDEITQHEEITFKILRASNRTSNQEFINAGGQVSMVLTGNPGGIGHCVPYGEVLTPDGWKDIKEIVIGDYVATDVNGETKFVSVDQTIKEYYEGKLLVSSNQSARFICTPEHKIPIVTETKNKNGRVFHNPVLRKVKDLKKVSRLPKIGKWEGYEIKDFVLENTECRKKKHTQPLEVNGDLYVQFMGWYLSEGFYLRKQNLFGISQEKQHNVEKISDLLDKMGFHYKWNGSSVVCYSKSWVDYLEIFGKCREKFIPRIIKESTTKQLRLFFDAMMAGDGYKDKHYYTTSKQLADDMCEIGIKLGYRVYMSSRQRNNRQGLSFDVSFKPNKLAWIEKERITEIDYEGMVYCLGIDKYHTFYLRQNGTVFLSGNSWCKRIFVDRLFNENENSEDFNFVQSFVQDNQALLKADPKYVDRLKDLPESLMKAYLYGDWNIHAGIAFNEMVQEKHLIDPIELPLGTAYFAGFDVGFNHPFAFVLCAVTPDSNIYVIHYLKDRLKRIDEISKMILELLRDKGIKKIDMYAGQDCWARGRDGSPTIAEQFDQFGLNRRNGINVIKAYDDRIQGVQELRKLFAWRNTPTEEPRVKFFRNTKEVFDTVASMQFDPIRPEDVMKFDAVDGVGGDDLYEGTRYSLVSRIRIPKTPEIEYPENSIMRLVIDDMKRTEKLSNLQEFL